MPPNSFPSTFDQADILAERAQRIREALPPRPRTPEVPTPVSKSSSKWSRARPRLTGPGTHFASARRFGPCPIPSRPATAPNSQSRTGGTLRNLNAGLARNTSNPGPCPRSTNSQHPLHREPQKPSEGNANAYGYAYHPLSQVGIPDAEESVAFHTSQYDIGEQERFRPATSRGRTTTSARRGGPAEYRRDEFGYELPSTQRRVEGGGRSKASTRRERGDGRCVVM